MVRYCCRLASILLVISSAGAGAVSAQTRATSADLTGVIYDPLKAVLPGATVTVTNADTGTSRTSVTEGDGRYAILALPPGTYTIRVELSGFTPLVQEGVALALGSSVDLSFTLTLAGAQEQVIVNAVASVVDTQKTAVSSVVSQQQIESLPINGRNFISFSVITPGVTTDRTPQQGASATSGLTFAGQRARSNNITVDGVDNNDAAVGAVRATFSQEAVREFQVLTNSYSAEFGKASGGVVNIVTKSGTNRLTGNLFGYFRDEALNAKEYFERFEPSGASLDREKASYGQTQYGFTLGGPLRRDRSFFFLSFERLDIDTNNFVNIDDRTIVTVGPMVLGTPKQILERAGFVIETGNVPYRVEGNQFLAKIDQQLTQSQNLAVRFNYADAFNENIEPWGGQTARSRGALLDSSDYATAASHTLVKGSRLVNELRFQYARRDQDVNALDPRCGGPCTADDQGGPTLEVTGFASVGRQRFTPQPRNSRRLQVLDSLSYFLGNHQLKSGFDFSTIDNVNEALPLHFGGRYIFAAALPGALFGLPVPTINAIQAVGLGLPAAYVQGYGNPSNSYRVSDLSVFVQDDWRPTATLTLKLGVRYQTQFWPDVEYTVRGIDPYRFPNDRNNVAPRLAFAWDPLGDRRTSIRGAYGLFFDNHITALSGITNLINGSTNVRTFVAQLPNPAPIAAWNAPGRRLPESALPAGFPSVEISADPGLVTPYAHHASVGVDRELPGELGLSATVVFARGFDQLGTIDYNPIVPALGAGRRPEDVNGVAGTSASILQYSSFGETWYRGLTVSATKRFTNRYQFLASYTLSKAEDNSTDFQSAFIPQNNGAGRNRQDLTGVPVGFNADDERGPSTQDQRHRFVFSGLYVAPADVQISSIITVASGRPYNILAGADLNGDGNGGAFPPDRARANPADPASSVWRNRGTLPKQAAVDLRVSRRFALSNSVRLDGIFEVFNLFNRTNFTEINNIFGTGAYPASPVSTFGQFTQAGSPRQVQLAVKMSF
ncbi:MAG TPA: carboxypeptidase regulatory-like domain-containing protein [Vicinamibacterales bacterium]|nr:carboxypeptidase regulatory-like domain-containing protein [Vicinamibacterales bacterium]